MPFPSPRSAPIDHGEHQRTKQGRCRTAFRVVALGRSERFSFLASTHFLFSFKALIRPEGAGLKRALQELLD